MFMYLPLLSAPHLTRAIDNDDFKISGVFRDFGLSSTSCKKLHFFDFNLFCYLPISASLCLRGCPSLIRSGTAADSMLANVTLTALNGNHQPSRRVINLKPKDKPVQIGRASKNSTKGLLGAKDNAWFDSPVMSRNHAQLSLDSMNNVRTHGPVFRLGC